MPQSHDAFISYSHSADGQLAPLLESGLEKLARPTFKLRAMNVFRDQTSLAASPGLWTGIVDHLAASRWFLLLASPASAASVWCGKEVSWWLEHRGVGSMLVVLTDGEIAWDAAAGDFDWARSTALSPALEGRFPEEPLFVDLRWARQLQQPVADDPRLRAAVLDLASPIRGIPKDELDGDDVRQLRRTRRIAQAGTAAIAVAALVATWQAVDATRQRKQAEQQRDRALSRQLAAQAMEMRVREPELALLLAAQAPVAEASPEAGTALLRVLKGLPLERLVAHPRRLFSLAVQGGHDTVALGDAAGSVLRLDPSSGRLEELTPPAAMPLLRAASALAISPDGLRIASAGYAALITLWQKGAPLRKIETPETREMMMLGLAFSPDGGTLASASSTGKLLLHDLAGGTMRALPSAGAAIARLAFSPDGRWLAGGGDGGVVRLWPVEGGAPLQVAAPAGGPVAALAFSGDGRILFSATTDGTLAFCDARTGQLQQRADARAYGELTAAALAPDGKRFVTTHRDGSVQRWQQDTTTAEWHATALMRHASEPVGIAFLADGRRIASAERQGRVFISRAIDVPALFERTGLRAALAGSAGPGSPSPPATPATRTGAHAAATSATVSSPDGKTSYRLRDGLLRAQDASNNELRAAPAATRIGAPETLSPWAQPDLAISPDGHWLALTTTPASDYSGATDNKPPRVALYRADSLTPVGEAVALFAEGAVASARSMFTGDQRWLVSLAGPLMTLVDVPSGQRLEEAVALPEDAAALGFAAGGSSLLFGTPTLGATLQIDLRIEALAEQACRLAGRSLTAQEWARYVGRERLYRPACNEAPTAVLR